MFLLSGIYSGHKEKVDQNGVGTGKFQVGVKTPVKDGFDGEYETIVVSVSKKMASVDLFTKLEKYKEKQVVLPVKPQLWDSTNNGNTRFGMWIELLGEPVERQAKA